MTASEALEISIPAFVDGVAAVLVHSASHKLTPLKQYQFMHRPPGGHFLCYKQGDRVVCGSLYITIPHEEKHVNE